MQESRSWAYCTGARDGRHQSGGRAGGSCRGTFSPALDLMGQTLPFHQLHAEVGAALIFGHLVDRHDMLVIEVGGQLGLAEKPLRFPAEAM